MVDNYLIESAIRIRTEFLELNSKLGEYEGTAKDMISEWERISNELKEYTSDKKTTKEDLNKITNHIFSKFTEMEQQINKIKSFIDPINNRIEELAKEEKLLWDNIKNKYPNIDDDLLIREIQSHLK